MRCVQQYKISIIIAVYNMRKYLKQCLNSVLSQTLKDIEVICVDDGSTDDSLKIIEYYSKNDKRIKVITQMNQGPGVARNHGIEFASGEYLAVMDPDDYYPSENCLELLYDAAKQSRAFIVGGNRFEIIGGVKYANKGVVFNSEGYKEYFKEQIMYGHQRFLFYTKLIKANDIKYADSRRFEDQIFIIRAMLTAKKYYTITEYVYSHRFHDTANKEFPEEIIIGMLKAYKECLTVAFQNDLKGLYADYLGGIPESFLKMYHMFPYTENYCKDIWDTLKEIYHIEKEWIGEVCGQEWNAVSLDRAICESLSEIDKFVRICRKESSLILYGAGNTSAIAMKILIEKGLDSKVKGFAQTKCEKKSSLFGKDVVELKKYTSNLDTAVVIMNAVFSSREEMKKNAISMGFNNVFLIKAELFSFADAWNYV